MHAICFRTSSWSGYCVRTVLQLRMHHLLGRVFATKRCSLLMSRNLTSVVQSMSSSITRRLAGMQVQLLSLSALDTVPAHWLASCFLPNSLWPSDWLKRLPPFWPCQRCRVLVRRCWSCVSIPWERESILKPSLLGPRKVRCRARWDLLPILWTIDQQCIAQILGKAGWKQQSERCYILFWNSHMPLNKVGPRYQEDSRGFFPKLCLNRWWSVFANSWAMTSHRFESTDREHTSTFSTQLTVFLGPCPVNVRCEAVPELLRLWFASSACKWWRPCGGHFSISARCRMATNMGNWCPFLSGENREESKGRKYKKGSIWIKVSWTCLESVECWISCAGVLHGKTYNQRILSLSLSKMV